MKNQAIRQKLVAAGLRYWQLADAVGISVSTLCVWLRHELEGERLRRVQTALDALTNQGEG